jgi:hypothetical protein
LKVFLPHRPVFFATAGAATPSYAIQNALCMFGVTFAECHGFYDYAEWAISIDFQE